MNSSPREKEHPYGIQSVDRVLAILEAVSESDRGLRPTDIVDQLDLTLSTAHRLMAHLAYRGYLEVDPETKRYHLGMKILLLRGSLLRSAKLEDTAGPVLRELAELTGEVAHLAVCFEGEVIYLRTMEGPRTTFRITPVGKRSPVYCTSLGKAMLAHLPPEAYREVVFSRSMQRLTPYTICTPEAMAEEVRRIRERGYAVDDQEQELGVRCVGVPIFDHSEKVVAAMSLAGPSSRVTPERVPDLAAILRERAEMLSRRLGYTGAYPEGS